MIRLSASLIKDFISCPQKAMYRIENPDKSVMNEAMEIGYLVHKIIEENLVYFEPLVEHLNDKAKKKLYRCIDNYEKKFKFNLTAKDDKIEYKFNYLLYKDVYMTGKIDRITNNNTVIDWKSSYRDPISIDNDIQFIVYYDTYKRLFEKEPKVLYVGLYTGNIIEYQYNEKYVYELYNRVIPEIVKSIKHKHYSRQGIFTGECTNCPFKDYCLQEEVVEE